MSGAPALPANIRLGWKFLPGTNTCLLRKSVNYSRKKFYSTGPWATMVERGQYDLPDMPVQGQGSLLGKISTWGALNIVLQLGSV